MGVTWFGTNGKIVGQNVGTAGLLAVVGVELDKLAAVPVSQYSVMLSTMWSRVRLPDRKRCGASIHSSRCISSP
jgi:hypothetical protein